MFIRVYRPCLVCSKHLCCGNPKSNGLKVVNSLIHPVSGSCKASELVECWLNGPKVKNRMVYSILLTYSMEQSPSWEANQFAVSREIPRILWNPKVHYRIHKCPLPVPILSQLNTE